jgi:hypothetical protein
MRQRTRRLIECQMDLARQHVLHARRRAAIRHDLNVGAGGVLEQDAREMRRAAHAGRSHHGLAGIGFQPRDQFLDVLCGHRLGGNDQLRAVRDQRHGFEIGQQVVGQRIDRAVDDVRAPMPDAQRIAVARRASDPADGDVAARAGNVLDDDRLSERGPHALAEDARDGVGRPASRKRHDHRDGTCGISLRQRKSRHDRERGSPRCQTEKSTTREFHNVPLAAVRPAGWLHSAMSVNGCRGRKRERVGRNVEICRR